MSDITPPRVQIGTESKLCIFLVLSLIIGFPVRSVQFVEPFLIMTPFTFYDTVVISCCLAGTFNFVRSWLILLLIADWFSFSFCGFVNATCCYFFFICDANVCTNHNIMCVNIEIIIQKTHRNWHFLERFRKIYISGNIWLTSTTRSPLLFVEGFVSLFRSLEMSSWRLLTALEI